MGAAVGATVAEGLGVGSVGAGPQAVRLTASSVDIIEIRFFIKKNSFKI